MELNISWTDILILAWSSGGQSEIITHDAFYKDNKSVNKPEIFY